LDAGLSEHEFRTILEECNRSLEKQISDDRNKLTIVADCLTCLQQGGSRLDVEQSLSDRKHPKTNPILEEKMKIPIKNMPAMKLVGLCYRGRNEHNEISDTWTTFNQRTNEITNSTGEAAYGVCSIRRDCRRASSNTGACCGIGLSEHTCRHDQTRAGTMQAAVFEHRGSYETLARTYTSIYQKWLPEAGWQPLKKGLDIEVYTDAFKDFAPDSLMYIYVPIQA
jgi:predicted transcriptional regulator YdeE